MADVRLTATNPEDSSVVPVACDASGRLLLEEQGQGPPGPEGPPGPKGDDGKDGKDGDPFSGNFAGDVTFGGSATFAGGKAVIDAGVYYSNIQSITAIGDTNDYLSMRLVNKAVEGVAVNSAQAEFWTGRWQGFDGNARSSLAIKLRNNAESSGSFVEAVKFRSDGSAKFAGDVNCGSRDTSSETARGCILSPTGALLAQQPASSADETAMLVLTRGRTSGGGAGEGISCRINADGSATFASNKAGFTKEGYFWCTTRRGDTVMLDFTSNGTGAWVEYTPTSRIDDLRDKLDANRPDTGEMPADTP